MKQRTLVREASIRGKALHSGETVQLTLKPAPAGHGIVFRRTDVHGQPEVKPDADLVTEVVRNTTVSNGHTKIHTIEHVLSALTGMGVDNALIEMDASEPPILDGSAKAFVELIEQAHIAEQDAEQRFHELDEPVVVSHGERSIVALPYDGFRITCTSADNRGIHTQHFSLEVEPESYRSQIATARTFTIYEDIEELLKMGKIQGGSLDSAIVIKGNKVLTKEPLRFTDEFVRHKILDIVGDMRLVGVPFKAHIVAILPGHALNVELARRLHSKFFGTNGEAPGPAASAATPPAQPLGRPSVEGNGTGSHGQMGSGVSHQPDGGPDVVLDTQGVLGVLPHRYPFILVDRVVDIDDEGAIVAVKNVTLNEPYFEGHFPGQPVMPGVLQIEAMAQAAGILMLTKVNKPGQLCYFMSCDKVKFRRAVTPGDQLEIKVRLLKVRHSRIALMAGECLVGGRIVSSGELMFTLVNEHAEEA
jgi:UDP-3-O-[3-hydroxymyristoyl] N-acetylglucosamine deacetylase/3-hydroxyacyl-[acyl-carrier-protein] dehydratase